MHFRFLPLVLLLVLSACADPQPATVTAFGDDPQLAFARAEIERALAESGREDVNFAIELRTQEAGGALAAEGFRIHRNGRTIEITGGDAAGTLYGGLELAELVRTGADFLRLPDVEKAPYLKRRGVKFNIPLDARTPSYTDASDAGQENIDDMWDLDFWKDYLDALARDRYNYVSLWSLHPFPSLIRVPDYPDVALADVHRSTADWDENYRLQAIGLDDPALLENPEIVRRMTVEEKIDFWRQVMRYGKERNIDFHLITWNIFTNGTGGKYGITPAIDNETTRDYFRKSIKQCFVTYPDLAGIGLTTGENMPRQSTAAKEEWAYDTYARGVLAAAAELPGRKITFIHRQHQTGAPEIAERFRALVDHPDIDFLFCFKYAKAHSMSATEQYLHQDFVRDIAGMKTLWGLRNDSNYHFRWGAPDFVRSFIKNLPREVAEGIYYGADQWVQGRDFLSRDSTFAGQLEIDKNWFHWALWGRLSYDPELTNERFAALIGARFPGVDGAQLLAAWQSASLIYPAVTGFHWGVLDFKWFPEASMSRPGPAGNETGFHDVNRFISLETHPKAKRQSIPDYVAGYLHEGARTPPETAAELRDLAAAARAGIADVDAANDPELAATLKDIRTVAELGDYYADKIDGATFVASYRARGNVADQQRAVSALQSAREHWTAYVRLANEQYRNPLWTNRVGYVDWAETAGWVAEDIEIARRAVPGE